MSLSVQFLIKISHRDSKWSKSGLPEPWIFEGVNELFLLGGEPNRTNKPNYAYKYVTLEGEEIEPLLLSCSISKWDQEYISFVYYRDPELQYDRLFHVKLFNSRY